MGGAAGSATTVYFLNNNNQMHWVTPLPTLATEDPDDGAVLSTGYLLTYDIAYQGAANDPLAPGDIWVATTGDSPISCYQIMSGTKVYSTNVVSAARGLAFSSESGSDYLWASNPNDGKIYQICLNPTGIEGGGGEAAAFTLGASSNPFPGSVVITGSEPAQGLIEIFDMRGAVVLQSAFDGSFTWDGEGSPSGVYLARVRTAAGQTASLSLVRL